MRLYLRFLLSFAVCISAAAATITGYLVDQSGSAKTGTIQIKPLSTPMLIGTNYVVGTTVSITLTNGAFTNSLIQGDYSMILGNSQSPIISVPDSTNTYNFVDLINTNGLLYSFKVPGSVVKLDQYDAVFGFLGDKLTFSSPLSVATNDYGANESITLSLPRGTNGASGYLHSSDWSSFTAKVDKSALTLITNVSMTLNATNYLELVIDGVTNKLAIVQ